WNLGPVKIVDTDWVKKLLPRWVRDALAFFLPVTFEGWVEVGVARRGATVLKEMKGHYSWAGLDTLEEQNKFYAKISFWCGMKPCSHFPFVCPVYCSKDWSGDLAIPIGWGSAVANNPATKDYEAVVDAEDNSYAGARSDTRTSYDAAILPDSIAKAQDYQGLTPYYDVADDRRASPDKAATFTLLVSKKASDVGGLVGALYDGSATGTQRSVGLPKTECADTLYALAQGRVRYARNEKYSSLYTPFWEGTLSDPDDKAKMTALVMARGVSLDGKKCGARLKP
ncbi:MAG TPA: hypothetical protein VNT02_04065, partial [Burkholderiales bacterium]|nr:hypothetical protein [Burkholderiales bacterium]